MKTPITLNITRADTDRVTFPVGVTWTKKRIYCNDNTGFTYTNRAGETIEYTIPEEMQNFVYFGFHTQMRALAEAVIILDVIKHENLDDTQLVDTPLMRWGGHEFELLNNLSLEQKTVKKAHNLCKRLLRAFTNVKKLSDGDLTEVTEENQYESVLITDETQRNIKLYDCTLDNPFLRENIGRSIDSCGFTIADGNTRHVYTLQPHLLPYDVCGRAFGDRRYALAALVAYTARRSGVNNEIEAYAEAENINSTLLRYVNDVVSGETPAEILDRLRLSWRVQSFVVTDD